MMFPRRCTTVCQSRSATMCQSKSATASPRRNARVCPRRSATAFPSKNATACPGSSAPRLPSRCPSRSPDKLARVSQGRCARLCPSRLPSRSVLVLRPVLKLLWLEFNARLPSSQLLGEPLVGLVLLVVSLAVLVLLVESLVVLPLLAEPQSLPLASVVSMVCVDGNAAISLSKATIPRREVPNLLFSRSASTAFFFLSVPFWCKNGYKTRR